MTTRQVIEKYFNALRSRDNWSESFSDDMRFVSHVVPCKSVDGRSAFIESTRRFYSMIASLEVAELFIDGDRGCALTRYHLQLPNGKTFASEVAEIFTVRNGRISGLDIFFDPTPFST